MSNYFVVLKCKDKEYKIPVGILKSRWWWTEGNGACDCNRSLSLIENGVDIKEMECGDTIELVDYNLKED